jgi:hypothetical protein
MCINKIIISAGYCHGLTDRVRLTGFASQLSLAICLSWLILFQGCAPLGPYHRNSASLIQKPEFSLAFIEFGEQGSYQDGSQLERAVKVIKETERPLVVTYVHGWQNNAVSADVGRFRNLLSELSNSSSVRKSNFHVIGVYLGWRGKLTGIPVVAELTFWSRKAAAERLASNFDLYNAIAAIAHAARAYHEKDKQYTLLLGHSFGGLIVERAVAHAASAAMNGLAVSQQDLPADLIVALNPASDSIITREMIAALYSRHLEGTRQFVISLTSAGDSATGLWFPIGTTIAAVSKVFDPVTVPGSSDKVVSEHRFYTSTPGHNDLLVNRKTVNLNRTVDNPSGKSAFEYNLSADIENDTFAIPEGPNISNSFGLWRFCPVKKPFEAPDVPYWDVAVDPQIIKNHGDIWNDRALAMVAAIFRMNFPLPLQAAPQRVHLKPKPNLEKAPDYNRLY